MLVKNVRGCTHRETSRKGLCSLLAVVGICGFIVATAYAYITIDFEDGTDGNNITDHYANLGVKFKNAKWRVIFPELPGMSGRVAFDHSTLGGAPTASNPIVGVFKKPVHRISVTAVDVGELGVKLEVFNAKGKLTGRDGFSGAGLGAGNYRNLTVTRPGIVKFKLYQLYDFPSADLVHFDNLAFEFQP
ncbi:hypothetical protein IH992_35345 [Candidatus Poribacteria bacterium]|nr:hypothetical protein [Candidatus Poribacteria bacterium]